MSTQLASRNLFTPTNEWEPLASTLFTRYDIHLHALLFENQVWFCTRDMGRLMGKYLDE